MKKSDFKQLKTRNKKELIKKILEEKKKLTNLLIEQSMSKIKNPHKISFKRKDIAQIMTILKLKEIEEKNANETNKNEGGKKWKNPKQEKLFLTKWPKL